MSTQIDASTQVQDASISTDKLANNVLSADASGRAKIQDGFFDSSTVTSKFGSASIALDRLAESVIQADGGQAFTADQSLGGFKITNLGAPSADTDAATKAYVDSVASSLDPKASVRVATTQRVGLDGTTPAYDNDAGTAGRGQITWATGPTALDGVTLSNGYRMLLKNEQDGGGLGGDANGIWVRTSQNTWDRATDFDQDAEVTAGAFTFAEEGTTNADSGWVLITDSPVVIGGASGTSLTFTQFSGAGQITAGAGLTKTGNTLDVISSNSAIVVNANDIALTLASNSGLEISSGLKVDPADLSLELVAGGLQVKRDTGATVGNVVVGASGIYTDVDAVGIETASNKLQLKDLGVTTAKIAGNAVTFAKLATAVQAKLGRYDSVEIFTGTTSTTQDLAVADVDGTAGADNAGLLVFKNGVLLSIAASDYNFDNDGGAGGMDRLTGLTRATGDRLLVLYNRTTL